MHYLKTIFVFFLVIFFCKNVDAKAINSDSTRLFYYSFVEDQVIELSTVRSVNYHSQISICSGANLNLKIPEKFKNASYSWTGPAGFSSYMSEINFEKVHLTQAGTYKVEINTNNQIQTGIFEVDVKYLPEPEIKIKNNSDFLKLNLLGIPEDIKVYWRTQDQTVLSSYKELIISKKNKDSNGLFVELKGEHCSNFIKIQ
jgi:hypothetical protein